MNNPSTQFDWDLVRSFVCVLEHGTLSGAARALGSSQPTLGRHISALEDQLSVTLFTRTGHALVPTPAAYDLAEIAQAMSDAVARLSLTAAGHSSALTGTVRVKASEVVATYILPALIGPLLEEEKELEIELVASNSTENLSLREADIAVRMHRPEQNDLIARKIGELEIGIFAHETYLERSGTPECLEDFGSCVFLGYDRSELMLRGVEALGIEASRSDFRLRTDDQVTYIEAIAAGAGIGATAVVAVQTRPGFVRLFPDVHIPPMQMWIAAHRELRTSARVRRVFDHLAEGLKELCAQETNRLRSNQ